MAGRVTHVILSQAHWESQRFPDFLSQILARVPRITEPAMMVPEIFDLPQHATIEAAEIPPGCLNERLEIRTPGVEEGNLHKRWLCMGGAVSEIRRDWALSVGYAVGFFACFDDGISKAYDEWQPDGGTFPP